MHDDVTPGGPQAIQSTFVPQGVRKGWRWYLSHYVLGREAVDADKELLINR